MIQRFADFQHNIIMNTDGYKPSHYLQYPDGTEELFDYVESRGGLYGYTLFVGLQAFLVEYLQGSVVTMDHVDFAAEFFKEYGEPFDYDMWEYIAKEHGGRLPLEIRAVREGSIVPTKNILVSVRSTDRKCAPLTSYIEPALLRAVWYPTTVATRSYNAKQIIKAAMLRTCDTLDGLEFKLHDFGARGVSSMESAMLGGLAHLVNFGGSDTISGIMGARAYYMERMAGHSIPAAEHSTMTILGRGGETIQMRRMIEKFSKPGSLFAVVSDGYDIMEACRKWGSPELKPLLLETGGKLIVRPDSGDPVRVTIEVLRELEKGFGATRNSKGFKVLNNVGVIYGDGINDLSIESILRTMEVNRYSADNIAFGMGGALLQQLDRDTQKFAMKCSAAKINDGWVDVYKDPITDMGKTSKKGQLSLFRNTETGEYDTFRIDRGQLLGPWEDQMKVVFRNGELFNTTTFEKIRNRANNA